MDTNKILSNVLKQQGIEAFCPIKNRENCYGYFKDQHFFICDEQLKTIPFEGKNTIVLCNNYTEYELVERFLEDRLIMTVNNHGETMIVNGQGEILLRGSYGASQREDDSIVLGKKMQIICDTVDLIRVNCAWYCRFYKDYDNRLFFDKIKSNFIKDGQVCKKIYLIGETSVFDIFIDFNELSEGECLVYMKNGKQIARFNCDFVWKHEDESLSLITNVHGKECKILEIDKYGNKYEYSVQMPHESIELRIAEDDVNVSDFGLTDYINDKYLVLEYFYDSYRHVVVLKRENGIRSIQFTNSLEIDIKHYWLRGVKNDILIVADEEFLNFYDLSNLKEIGSAQKKEKYVVIKKNIGDSFIYGVMKIWDTQQEYEMIVPLRFDDITIIEDSLFVVDINNSMGIYSEKSLIIPIGQLTGYKQTFNNVIEYSSECDRKGLLFIEKSEYGRVDIHIIPAEYKWFSYQECYGEFGYRSNNECGWIELHKGNKCGENMRFGLAFRENIIEAEDVFDRIEYINDNAAYVYCEGKKGYCNKSGVLIEPQYDRLDRMGYGLFYADGNIIRYNREDGIIQPLANLGRGWFLIQMRLGYYAFKRGDTNEYKFWNYDRWSGTSGGFHDYSTHNGYIRLDSSVVYLGNGNGFICKEIKGVVAGPPEEYETIEDILKWERDTIDDDEIIAHE